MRNAPSRLATQLQQAIRASGLSYYRLAKISGGRSSGYLAVHDRQTRYQPVHGIGAG